MFNIRGAVDWAQGLYMLWKHSANWFASPAYRCFFASTSALVGGTVTPEVQASHQDSAFLFVWVSVWIDFLLPSPFLFHCQDSDPVNGLFQGVSGLLTWLLDPLITWEHYTLHLTLRTKLGGKKQTGRHGLTLWFSLCNFQGCGLYAYWNMFMHNM